MSMLFYLINVNDEKLDNIYSGYDSYLRVEEAVECLLTWMFMADSHPDWLNFRSFYENMMWFNKKQ